MDIYEPFKVTLEMIEKAIFSIKKISDINIENKDVEDVVNDTLEILVGIRDQSKKKQSMLNQWPKKSTVNLITENITKSEVCIICIKMYYYYY